VKRKNKRKGLTAKYAKYAKIKRQEDSHRGHREHREDWVTGTDKNRPEKTRKE